MSSRSAAVLDASRRRWAVGACGFSVMVAIGSMYGMSALLSAVPGPSTEHPGAAHAAAFVVTSAGLALGSPLGGRMLVRFQARFVALVGAALWAAANVLAGLGLVLDVTAPALPAAFVGGLGVGLAYLTVVATVGRAFSARPAVGAAIGPFGFATGTGAMCLLAAVVLAPGGAGAAGVGRFLVVLGAGLALLAGTALGLTRGVGAEREHGPARGDRLGRGPRLRLAALLFVNAFPGMLMLGLAFPSAAAFEPSATYAATAVVIAGCSLALFLGGVMSSVLRTALGERATFVVLLAVRGVLLSAAPFLSGLGWFVVVLAVVLLAHGVGFGVLPAVVRRRSEGGMFVVDYGEILTAWGVAGVVATGLAVVVSLDAAFLAAGALALVTAGTLLRGGRRAPLA